MGRKKGKQSGTYKSKALRIAANHIQWNNTKEDLQLKSSRKNSEDGKTSEVARVRNSMNVATRMYDAVFAVQNEGEEVRLRRMCNSVNVCNGSNSSSLKDDVIKVKRHSVGWVLAYPGEKGCVLKRDNNMCVPSLSRLCIDVLAKALPMYMEEVGFIDLKLVLGSLGPHALTMLSACVAVDDELALVVGQHADVHSLVLRSNSNSLTDKAINALTPRLLNISKDGKDCDWEELDNSGADGCMNLRRLELLDAQDISFLAISNFFRFSPCITHLSISNSFDNVTGPRLLLDESSNIFSCLPGLQLLDLSHCSWLDDSILAHVFSRLYQESHPVLRTLTLVSVAGCPHVTLTCLRKLNDAFFFSKPKPVLCTNVHTQSILHLSSLTDSVVSTYSFPRNYQSSLPIGPPIKTAHWWDLIQ